MTDVEHVLSTHLHGMAAPFLFVGAGVSRRYMGADDWEGLLRKFANATGLPYEYYRSSAGSDLPTVATKLASAFHDLWWSSPNYEKSRTDWVSQALTSESALKIEVACYLKEATANLPSTGLLAEELTLLKEVVVDGIITTNYDLMLEELFPDFRVFVGQDELLFSNPQGVGEIYKIHGCVTSPNSLILTAADYERFELRNPYLAAKLMATFVERPVVFLGYSLSDRNIVAILRSLARCLTQENISKLADRLIFVQWSPDGAPSMSPHTIVVDDFIFSVQRVLVRDFLSVFAALRSLDRTFPAPLLRRLKEKVYELVLSDDPRGRLHVSDIDDDTNMDEIDVVFGVGMKSKFGQLGYTGLNRWALIDDTIANGATYDASLVVRTVLPVILSGTTNCPVFKYLSEGGFLDVNGLIREDVAISSRIVSMAERVREGLASSTWHKERAHRTLEHVDSLAQLEEQQGVTGMYAWGTLMPPGRVDVDSLQEFLIRNRDKLADQWQRTQYIKLACLYDWLRYGAGSVS